MFHIYNNIINKGKCIILNVNSLIMLIVIVVPMFY